ncbi:MAG: bifunctional 4-hydroxy-2-oxoglutarate aldolase/2-dehydro-3-deoxy-phosphogluconate aldolase [Pseudomonadota bacterium]
MTPEEASKQARDICALAPVIPVLTIPNASKAEGLARALVTGGLPALEVTLRTPAALDAVRVMAQVDGGVVGVGTIMTPDDVVAAKDAGALFGVSPGSSPRILDKAEEVGLPMLPGAATATEIMALLDRGYTMLKFFPAEASGGAPALGAFSGPIPQATFCPTGGVSLKNVDDYLSLKNTVCVGGSWVAPADMIEDEDWAGIEKLASEAAALTS